MKKRTPATRKNVDDLLWSEWRPRLRRTENALQLILDQVVDCFGTFERYPPRKACIQLALCLSTIAMYALHPDVEPPPNVPADTWRRIKRDVDC